MQRVDKIQIVLLAGIRFFYAEVSMCCDPNIDLEMCEMCRNQVEDCPGMKTRRPILLIELINRSDHATSKIFNIGELSSDGGIEAQDCPREKMRRPILLIWSINRADHAKPNSLALANWVIMVVLEFRICTNRYSSGRI